MREFQRRLWQNDHRTDEWGVGRGVIEAPQGKNSVGEVTLITTGEANQHGLNVMGNVDVSISDQLNSS